jgi:hypothetical protein
MADGKQPVSKISIYPVSAAIWKNEGSKGSFYSVTFERTYKDGDQYKSSSSFTSDHLLTVAKIADIAHSEILRLRGADREPSAEE